jgi:4-hydroxyphenylpyruvate dioxygenase-like putative hemolysin
MKTSVATVCLSGGLSENLQAIAAAGFRGIEIFDGEYLEVYTKSFKDLFFFEIVERKGYRGFGAINAPIRLNAQSRLARDTGI